MNVQVTSIQNPIGSSTPHQPCSDPLMGISTDIKDPFSQPQDCASLCGATLSRLHSLRVDSGSCSTKSRHDSPQALYSIEDVLITNKAAIKCMDKILACPCSNNPHYALSLALMCHKILVRYEAIVESPTADSPHPPKADNYSPTPITVGAYKMDTEDERRLRIQLTVNELRKMKGVIERYEDKYCQSEMDGDEDRAESIYPALENFLRSNLKAKLKHTINALQD